MKEASTASFWRQVLEASQQEWAANFLERLVVCGTTLGYSFSIHGSGNRDLDVIATPWVEDAVLPNRLVVSMCSSLGMVVKPGDDYPIVRPHGRLGWVLFGCPRWSYLDLSVMPTCSNVP